MDAESAQRELDEILPDVILLDWMLPGESGLTLARRWRFSPFPHGTYALSVARGI